MSEHSGNTEMVADGDRAGDDTRVRKGEMSIAEGSFHERSAVVGGGVANGNAELSVEVVENVECEKACRDRSSRSEIGTQVSHGRTANKSYKEQRWHSYASNGRIGFVMPSRVLNSPQNVVTMGRFADCYQPTYGQMITSALTQSDIYNLSNANQPYQPTAYGVPRVWNGELLPRTYNNPLVVFKSLNQAFGKYGSCHVEWPIKEAAYHSPSPNRAPTQRAKATGYVYVVYKNESSVKKLMHDCSHELGAAGECYFKLKARRSQVTEVRQVQVIPWVVSDVAYMRCPPTATESRLTVFVGALHGMLTAKVMTTSLN
ncbi:unnamed protein product [Toxocara canis]|uniref:RRM domain-containing protein n=1 Tax=Toxocara canis TaxID=6265 RepID=A0A183VA94_TOXCA|nr:unnamed protein product [Toxocara canis]